MAESMFEAAERKDWSAVASMAGKVDKPDSFADTKGHTALHMCVMNGAPLEVVQALLSKGADPNKKQTYGNTSVHLAAGSPHGDAAAAMLDVLFEFGADANKRNNAESTPLHVAVNARASVKVFKSLLGHGADPSKKLKGKTVVEAANLAGLPSDVVAALQGG